MFRKGIALVVMLLFIGLSIVPSSSTKQVFDIGYNMTQNLNNDYVNAYWKFDECSGSTAYDSSGHNYDGTIYGATWVGGIHSGCALDFDGLDDYVDLDNHTVGLGFNKTDDLVFSFYFKSSTNHKGMIYSMSTDYGTNPEFHIFIDSNGSIGIEVNVTSGGFELFAGGSFNDDTWHYVEVWYNGISNKPKVDIYIDNEHEAHAEKYVCAFSNDEFDLVKIGRRSHTQTDYFDGIIDEFKYIKYPGGNKQNPPEISGPTVGEPGVEYNFTFVTNDPENDSIWLRINLSGVIYNWSGPYESGEEVIVSYEWPENGTYRIGAQSKDIWNNSTWSYHTIRIGNEAPEALNITGPHYGRPGVNYTFCIEGVDPNGDDLFCMWDWDDGSNTEWLGPYASGEIMCATHAWSEEGTYVIRVKLKDIYGNESSWMSYLFIVDAGAPHVEITKPKRAIYIRDNKIIPFIVPVIIGDIQIWFWAEDSLSGLNRTELFIDNELKETFTTCPKSWLWNETTPLKFRHRLELIAYDNAGNNATKKMTVWKFF